MFEISTFLYLWIGSAWAASYIARTKHNQATRTFLWGLLLGPMVLVAFAFSLPYRMTCGMCMEAVHPGALKCPHCGWSTNLEPEEAARRRSNHDWGRADFDSQGAIVSLAEVMQRVSKLEIFELIQRSHEGESTNRNQ